MSQEEMISQAEELDLHKLSNDSIENEVKAKQTYDGKIFKVTGNVDNITLEYVMLCNGYYGSNALNPIKVFLSDEDVAKLEKGKIITVVGKLSYKPSPNIDELTDAFVVKE